jgi:hypothetical protein
MFTTNIILTRINGRIKKRDESKPLELPVTKMAVGPSAPPIILIEELLFCDVKSLIDL